jgi:hypothetical protein
MVKQEDVNTVFFGPMVGELGWACSRWHAWCRYRRFHEFANLKSIVADYDWRYPLYSDFIDEFIPLPEWFTQMGLEQDCYEAVAPGSPAGAVMEVGLYTRLTDWFKQYYNPNTTWVVRPPRGCNFIIQERAKQMWKQLEASPQANAYADSLLAGKDLSRVFVLSGRKRARALDRNVPDQTWEAVVDVLTQHDMTVVITGTKHSSALVNKVGRNVINVIPRTGVDGLDVLIALMRRAKMTITSQSGPTLISLLCETPSYIIGHEAERHSKTENFMDAPAMFRTVPYNVYAGITPDTILQDVFNFNNALEQAKQGVEHCYNVAFNEARGVMHSLLVEPINLYNLDAETVRKEILYGK